MADRPTLYLTNWSSRRLHGPGQKWTIMARPRAWERGAGVVVAYWLDVGEIEGDAAHAWAWLVVEQIGQGDEGDTLASGTAPTALEAIEAAEAARREVAGG